MIDDKEDYRDDMTLSEIAENDTYMVEETIRNADRFFFYSLVSAQRFVGACMKNTMDYIGVKIRPNMHEKMVDRLLKSHKVQVEHRNKYQDEDAWRNGIYIYKNGELVAFISTVLERDPYGKINVNIPHEHARYVVITNARKARKLYSH